MVGLPHRRDRSLDEDPLPIGPRPAREQVPQPAAVVGATEERVDDERAEGRARNRRVTISILPESAGDNDLVPVATLSSAPQ